MANTYIQIGSTVTVGSGGSSTINFTSIPSTYTDLKLVMSLRGANGNTFSYVRIDFNGVSTNQIQKSLYSGDASPGAGTQNNFEFISQGNNTTSNTFGNAELYIPNYANTSYNKSASLDYINENNLHTAGAQYQGFNALLWSSTAAINQVTLTGITGNFVQNSTATLYGIKNS